MRDELKQSPLTFRLFVAEFLAGMGVALTLVGLLMVEFRRWGDDATMLLGAGGIMVVAVVVFLLGVRHQRWRLGDGPSWGTIAGYTATTMLIPMLAAVGLSVLWGGSIWVAALGFLVLSTLVRAATFPLLQRYADG